MARPLSLKQGMAVAGYTTVPVHQECVGLACALCVKPRSVWTVLGLSAVTPGLLELAALKPRMAVAGYRSLCVNQKCVGVARACCGKTKIAITRMYYVQVVMRTPLPVSLVFRQKKRTAESCSQPQPRVVLKQRARATPQSYSCSGTQARLVLAQIPSHSHTRIGLAQKKL